MKMAAELETLRRILDAAPGVTSIASIRPHHKGGYAVAMELDREALDSFIAYLDGAGWMSVL